MPAAALSDPLTAGPKILVMESLKALRNVAIVVLIAAAVYLLPGGGQASQTFLGVVYIGFAVAIGYLGLRFYREHRVALHSLGDLHRGVLYGAIAFAVLAYAARARMWESGLGELLWFVLVGAIVYAFLAVYRHWRAY